MKRANLFVILFAAAFTAQADFSYSTAPQNAGGAAGVAASVVQGAKYYFKGDKMKMETGETVIILDFDAQTVTGINNRQRTYSVTPFSEIGQNVKGLNDQAQAEIKETGQKKNINGYEASELLMTLAMDNPQARQSGMQMQVEIEMWLSPDVPGASELANFYKKNSPKFPWTALGAAGSNPQMRNAFVEMQKRMAGSGGGVPVLQVFRGKMGGAQAAQLQQSMGAARARLEEMAKQPGAAGDAARNALARMGGGAGGGGSLFEMTMESSNFSTNSIPASVFEIPAGYQKTEKK